MWWDKLLTLAIVTTAVVYIGRRLFAARRSTCDKDSDGDCQGCCGSKQPPPADLTPR